ncbi:MAG: hypothetical protein JNM59_00830 [Hyphomonadaceae bacterium]|nr:hypothetical protein [Hyphomonadaceae bacterium]
MLRFRFNLRSSFTRAQTVIPGERSETQDPAIIEQRVGPWVPDNAFGVSGMTEFDSVLGPKQTLTGKRFRALWAACGRQQHGFASSGWF